MSEVRYRQLARASAVGPKWVTEKVHFGRHIGYHCAIMDAVRNENLTRGGRT